MTSRDPAPGDGDADRPDEPVLNWAVVANVCDETRFGEGDALARQGVKHFPPGAKVWVLPAQWGDGWDRALVVGRHRGAPRPLAQMVVPLEHLEDFRVEAVYSPALDREMRKPSEPARGEPVQWSSKEQAEDMIRRHPLTRLRLKRPAGWTVPMPGFELSEKFHEHP